HGCGRLVVGCEPAGLDPGAGVDPLIGRIDVLTHLVIGDDPRWTVRTEAQDPDLGSSGVGRYLGHAVRLYPERADAVCQSVLPATTFSYSTATWPLPTRHERSSRTFCSIRRSWVTSSNAPS